MVPPDGKGDGKLKVYLEHRAALINYATPITGSRASAEDVVQDAYFRFVPSADCPQQPVAYLYRTVRNLALDAVRRLSMEGRYQQEENVPWLAPAPLPQPEHTVLHQDQLQQVAAGLDALPEMARRAVEMRRLEGRSLDEIADILGISAPTAYRLIRDAMVKVAQRLDE